MFLKSVDLSNFRNYEKASFDLNAKTTFVVGPNTSGKTNFLEAVGFLSTGKSSRGAKDEDVLRFGQEVLRIKGKTSSFELEVVITAQRRKYLVNGVSKSRINFAGNLFTASFSPQDLDIITGSPHLRREFLDMVLEQVDRDYRLASISYSKALRQRNALLDKTRESGTRNQKQFEYWDNLLINTGSVITEKREEFIAFINAAGKDVFDFLLDYDKSVISEARLDQYKDAEVASGVTLVGPHRDDFSVSMFNNKRGTTNNVKVFGSRGQQRLVVLQLKLLQLSFMEKVLGFRPLLLLDDIFSELDTAHIRLVTEMIAQQQSIVTTTHEEFIDKKLLEASSVIELKRNGEKS